MILSRSVAFVRLARKNSHYRSPSSLFFPRHFLLVNFVIAVNYGLSCEKCPRNRSFYIISLYTTYSKRGAAFRAFNLCTRVDLIGHYCRFCGRYSRLRSSHLQYFHVIKHTPPVWVAFMTHDLYITFYCCYSRL